MGHLYQSSNFAAEQHTAANKPQKLPNYTSKQNHSTGKRIVS
jgi:hypothetical protein